MNGSPRPEEFDERTRRALASLADGSLQGYERAELEARLASSPTLRAALERQRTGATALRGVDLAAPAGLRARVEAARASARPTPRRRRRWTIGGPIAAAAAAAALVAILVLPSGTSNPTVPEVASLYQRPAIAAVGADPSNTKLLAADVEGVPFPNWKGEFGWREAGTRTDELGGRTARTVFYRQDGRRIAYTIVSGDGIRAPSGSHPTRINGVNLHSFDSGGRHVVTWWRDGRTCVLSASGVGGHELLTLASWKGDGAVPF
jgi:hypothetical protein